MRSQLYFECHVTLDPVLSAERQLELRTIANRHGFRLAALFMEKGPSTIDSFLTGRDELYTPLAMRMIDFVREVGKAGFVIRRYKIENTLIDSRTKDELCLLYSTEGSTTQSPTTLSTSADPAPTATPS